MNDIELYDRLMEEAVGKKRQVNFRDKDGLRLFKYSRDAFFSRSWLDENKDLEFLVHARGIVFEIATKKVVCRPFQRLEELDLAEIKEAGVSEVIATYKVNGFMASVWYHGGKWNVSTTGSLESPFVDLATKALKQNGVLAAFDALAEKWVWGSRETIAYKDVTFLFEIVDQSDPHIIMEQKGRFGNSVWLIGGILTRSKETGLGTISGSMNRLALEDVEYRLTSNGAMIYLPQSFDTPVADLEALANSIRHEGYMISDMNGKTFAKFKSPFYKILKFLGRSKRLANDAGEVFPIEHTAWTNKFTEPMFHLVELIFKHNFQASFVAMDEHERIKFLTERQNEIDWRASMDAGLAVEALNSLRV